MSDDGKGTLILGTLLLVLAAVSFVLPLLSLLPKEFALAGPVFLILGVVFTGSGIYMRARVRREAEIREKGIEGKAKLVRWWILGKSLGELNTKELCKFELDVMVEGKPVYKVKHRQLVPFGIYSQFSNGMVLPLKVHREKPERVMLDWERVEGQVIDGMTLPDDVIAAIKGLKPLKEKGDLKDRLRELEDAYKERLISADEYESKRAEILKNL